MAKINPFQPNNPVSPGMFVGRLKESDRIDDHLLQARAENPASFLLTGERGIGKSSLLYYTQIIADGSITTTDDQRFNFLVVSTDIDENTTQLGLIRKIELGLRRTVEKNEKALGVFRKGWEFLKKVEAVGVSLKEDACGPTEVIIEEAAYALAQTVNDWTSERVVSEWGLSGKYDGLLLLIDEADNASPDLKLGSFLKLFLERVNRAGCRRFLIGLAGLPKVRDVLTKSHGSSLRSFEELKLGPLSADETARVIDVGLKEAAAKNGRETTITPDAKKLLVTLSEGLPHFIQQFSFSAFSCDTDWNITKEDVVSGAYDKGGALELIGDRYYRDGYFKKIRQDSYRKVLRIMASLGHEWVKKDEIRAKFKGTATSLDNAIHALIKQNFIVTKEGERAVYRLVHRGFATWIFMKDPQQLQDILSAVFLPGTPSSSDPGKIEASGSNQ